MEYRRFGMVGGRISEWFGDESLQEGALQVPSTAYQLRREPWEGWGLGVHSATCSPG